MHRDELYLTGVNDRNLFDLHAYHFQVQEPFTDTTPGALNPVQPWVLPSFDYSRMADNPVAGGELTFTANAQGIYRDTLQSGDQERDDRHTGTGGKFGAHHGGGRMEAHVHHARRAGDHALAGRQDRRHLHQFRHGHADGDRRDSAWPVTCATAYFRYMATAGLELRCPVLFSTTSATNVIEPVVQIFASPNEQFATTAGIPNEDSQSFVFDASNLLQRDRFAGYDRMEGGVRANVALRYTGTFANGWSASAIFGQSYHLAGLNSFGPAAWAADFVNVGADSGLDTDVSDYVGQVGLNIDGLGLSAGARLDKSDLEMRRADVTAAKTLGPVSLSAQYAYIQAQPDYGFATDRHSVTVSGSTRITQDWTAFASGTYDIAKAYLATDSYGVSFANDCFNYTMSLSETRPDPATTGGRISRTFAFQIGLRTLGQFGNTSTGLIAGVE